MFKPGITFGDRRDGVHIIGVEKHGGTITFDNIDALDNFMFKLADLRDRMEKAKEDKDGINQES